MADEISILSIVRDKIHEEACQKMLNAVHEYFNWRSRNGMKGAVIWVKDDCGRLVVFTRGEYASDIERVIRQHDGYLEPDICFGDSDA